MAFHFNKLESSSPKNALCQVLLKLAQWFWKSFYFILVNVFLLFHNYLAWKWRVLHLNKFESHSPKDALYQICLKLAYWFWSKGFKFINVFFAISLLSPLGKGSGPSFEQIWMLFAQGCFISSLFEVEVGPVVLEKKKMWKFTTTTTTMTTDNGQIVIRKSYSSFRLRCAKICFK